MGKADVSKIYRHCYYISPIFFYCRLENCKYCWTSTVMIDHAENCSFVLFLWSNGRQNCLVTRSFEGFKKKCMPSPGIAQPLSSISKFVCVRGGRGRGGADTEWACWNANLVGIWVINKCSTSQAIGMQEHHQSSSLISTLLIYRLQ